MDKASKKALRKTSPPFQCRAIGGFMSINRCRMVSAFMGQIRFAKRILPVRAGAGGEGRVRPRSIVSFGK
jgi:hypothetical protein